MLKQDIVDLTYLISKGGSRYPTDPDPRIVTTPAEVSNEGKIKSGYTELTIRTHHGTHIDAPAHKIPFGKTIDQYDLSKFINPAFLIDLMPYLDDPEFAYIRIISEDILRWVFTSKLLRRMRENEVSALIFRTGYDKDIERGVSDDFNFPYFEKEAAEFLVKILEQDGMRLNLVGIDSFSVDQKGSWDSPAHRAFLSKDILLVETLVHLKTLKEVFNGDLFEFICMPILYESADGAQTRAFAKAIPKGERHGNPSKSTADCLRHQTCREVLFQTARSHCPVVERE